jgi:hypothetical protein
MNDIELKKFAKGMYLHLRYLALPEARAKSNGYRPARDKRRRARGRQLINAYKKKNFCAFCGEAKPQFLVFHHVFHDDKFAKVSDLVGKSASRITAEIAKCIVLCADCHNGLHAKLTERQALAIRADERSQRKIAADYGIRQQHVSRIKAGKSWRPHPVKPMINSGAASTTGLPESQPVET